MTKKFLPIVGILFLGLIPILLYLALHGGLGASVVGQLQELNRSERSSLMASLVNIKPAYMLLCVGLLVILWGRASLPARALFWGITALVIGELTCGTIFFTFRGELILSEHIHSYGMQLEYIFIALALLEVIDQRVLQNQIGIRTTFAFAAGVGMFASFLPLTVSTTPGGYHADLYGFPYIYARFAFNQWVESRFLPLASLAMFALTLFIAIQSKQTGLPKPVKYFLPAGIGLLAFSILRLTLGALFADRLVWFEFWEEMIQLIVIFTIAFSIWYLKREWIEERIDTIRFSQKDTGA